MPRAAARDDGADGRRNARNIRSSLCASFNTCPICWMPLQVDERELMDGLWKEVSTLFKSKPAFSIKHPSVPGSSLARHVLAFGTAGDPTRASAVANNNDSHFVHFSMAARDARLESFWDLFTAGQGQAQGGNEDYVHMDVIETAHAAYTSESNVSNQHKNLSDAFNNFYMRANVEGGIFSQALCDESLMVRLLEGEQGLNINAMASVMRTLHGTFTGCSDCNMNMTLKEHVPNLFMVAFFPVRLEAENNRGCIPALMQVLKRNIGVETMMHYIMLSGAVYAKDVVQREGGDGRKPQFNVSDAKRRESWKTRFALIWCALQTMICLWVYSADPAIIAHHRGYIHAGGADFYMSLMLYVLHAGLGQGGSRVISFETFHYFYSSHMPFFVRGSSPNLAFTVLGLNDKEACKRSFNIQQPGLFSDKAFEAVQLQLKQIMDGVAKFWKEHFKQVSAFIHGTGRNPEDFFVTPERMKQLVDSASRYQHESVSVQAFCDILQPAWYWYHFRRITMQQVMLLSKNFEGCIVRNDRATAVWRQWYRMFNGGVHRLQALAVAAGRPAQGSMIRRSGSGAPPTLRAHLLLLQDGV